MDKADTASAARVSQRFQDNAERGGHEPSLQALAAHLGQRDVAFAGLSSVQGQTIPPLLPKVGILNEFDLERPAGFVILILDHNAETSREPSHGGTITSPGRARFPHPSHSQIEESALPLPHDGPIQPDRHRRLCLAHARVSRKHDARPPHHPLPGGRRRNLQATLMKHRPYLLDVVSTLIILIGVYCMHVASQVGESFHVDKNNIGSPVGGVAGRPAAKLDSRDEAETRQYLWRPMLKSQSFLREERLAMLRDVVEAKTEHRKLRAQLAIRVYFAEFFKLLDVAEDERRRIEAALLKEWSRMNPSILVTHKTSPKRASRILEKRIDSIAEIFERYVDEGARSAVRSYVLTQPVREIRNDIRAKAFLAGHPLSESQANAVLQLILVNSNILDNPLTRAEDSVDWSKVVDGASSLLSESQMAVLRAKQLSAQLTEIYRGLTGLPERPPVKGF